MRTEVIKADTIDVAVEGILSELNRSRQNIIYFDGWDGLGASAVLRAVAQRLKLKEPARPPGLEFQHVIHIDCSKWESTRAVQREIAKQLKLPTRIMEMFDKQDEEDDFNGVTDQGSRTEMEDVAVEIQRSTQDRRFLLVLHNGSNEEIELSSLGLSVFRYMTNKVVWTFQGRFRINSKMRDKVMKKNTTDVLLSASRSKRDLQELWSYLLREEATQVACKHGIDPALAVECFLYVLTLNCIHGHHVDTEYDLVRHTCNYWICDGIIQKVTGIDEALLVGDALQREMQLDIVYFHNELPSHLIRHDESIAHWSSPVNGFVVVPAGVIPKGMFQHFDKLCVLKLSRCAFSFSSPPFLCCLLKFLWLDHCQDLRSSDAEKKEEDEDTTRSWACFKSLWVLDLRYTDCDWILSAQMMDVMTQLRELIVVGAKNWDMSHLRGRLRNIRKLRVIKADTIDVAVEGILSELNRSRQNILYFDGWDGLGASAVLRAVAQRLKLKEPARPPGPEFEHVIHIDCSKWESARAVQREIAEQLKLPSWVMEVFDKQDEEEDFNGITDQGSRKEIAEVTAEIQRGIEGHRFLLVLHNGSNEEIDISDLGLSVYGYLRSKMLWTFQGRFRIDSKVRDKVMKKNTTDVLLSASRSERDLQELWSYLLHEEATQVVCKHGVDPTIVVDCFLYMLTLHCTSRSQAMIWLPKSATIGYVMGSYRKSDTAEAWQIGEALQGEIRLEMDYHHSEFPSHLLRYAESIPHWTSPTHGFVLVPTGVVPRGTFQYFDKLGVIKLSRCSFSFSSPPFLCCRSLRFLCLDHCQDLRCTDAEQREDKEDISRSWECSQSLWVEDEEDTTRSWECFQSLWVLDLRYTDLGQFLSARVVGLMTQLRELNVMGSNYWNMSHLWRQLRNIRKLRVTKSTCYFDKNLFSEMKSLELLDFSGSIFRQSMLGASNGGLKTVIIDGCDLEEISFRGCKELKNLFLKGIFRFHKDRDLSGTSVKTLSLRECLTLPHRIILLGCEELRAILWPNEGLPRWSGVLYIDTTSTSPSADGREEPHPRPHGDGSLQREKEQKFKDGWKISLTDARLLRSLYPVIEYLDSAAVHIDVCSAAIVGSSSSNVKGTRSDNLVQVQPRESTMYRDVLKDGPVAPMIIWDCRTIPALDQTCIIKVIMHGQCKDAPSFSTSALVLPDFIYQTVTSLHVYDNWSITSIPEPSQGSGWADLRWCRMERCPKLHTVFSVPKDSGMDSFYRLRTFWASQLLSARYIWAWPVKYYFKSLMFMHLD